MQGDGQGRHWADSFLNNSLMPFEIEGLSISNIESVLQACPLSSALRYYNCRFHRENSPALLFIFALPGSLICSRVRIRLSGYLNHRNQRKEAGMIITVASFKGGVGKTTTAVHLAAYLSGHDKTILIDGDPNRSSTAWKQRGSLPFDVADEAMAAKAARNYEHLIIDTAARPDADTLRVLADSCDLLVIPTTTDGLSFDALMLTVDALQKVEAKSFRILLTMIPPKPARDGEIARQALEHHGLPLFATSIRHLKAFKTAGTQGVLVSEVKDPRAPLGWEDYAAVGRELMDIRQEKAA